MQFVSVIIPSYNHAAYLDKRIKTILNQTFQDFEIIILDDFSTDHSKNIIESYRRHPKVTHISYNESNSGSTFKQWAKGIALAKGEYIWIAESDDRCENNFLEELLNKHQNLENIGIAYCKSLPIGVDDQVYDYSDSWMKRVDPEKWESDYFNYGSNECEKYLSVQCTIPNASAVLFKKIAFSNVDFTQINFKICGDWLIYVQILSSSNIAYSAKPLNYHRNHQDNARSKYFNLIIEEQFNVLSYIAKNFTIKKTRAFHQSLDERVAFFITAIIARKISGKQFLQILKNMFSVDHWIIFRIAKVFFFKLFRIDTNFK